MKVISLLAMAAMPLDAAFLPPRFHIEPSRIGGKLGPLVNNGGGTRNLPALVPLAGKLLPAVRAGLPAVRSPDGGFDPKTLLCGGKRGETCPPGTQCRLRPLQCRDDENAVGACVPDVVVCFFRGPKVCGCDGRDYDSSCDAYKAGTNVASFSTCGGAPDAPVPSDIRVDPLPPPKSGWFHPHIHKVSQCTDDKDCDSGEFCRVHGCGARGKPGRCSHIPTSCSASSTSPVCGCDGFTYSSYCEASRARANIASRGPCATIIPALPVPADAGPEADIPFPVPVPVASSSSIWHYARQWCGGIFGDCKDPRAKCVGVGVGSSVSSSVCGGHVKRCVVVEELPPSICVPGEVCTCNGQTMNSLCEAWQWSYPVRHTGACTPSDAPVALPPADTPAAFGPTAPSSVMGSVCGSDGDCDDGFFCSTAPGQCDGVGSCKRKPAMCVKSIFQSAVCGCDGVTYSNACEAASAGVSYEAVGVCADPQTPSEGTSPIDIENSCSMDDDCDDDEFCDLELADCGSASDVKGFCKKPPTKDECMPSMNVLCGCDGMFYSSKCFANAARVSISQSPLKCALEVR